MEKARIGIIGLGWMGSEHARNILASDRAELAVIADADETNLRAIQEQAACETVGDLDALLKTDIDAVVIATPNAMHAEMCIAAAKAGKHIYCEKPLAITFDDCKRVREAVEAAGVKFLIGYHRRFNPLYQYAKGLVADGRLGEPFMIESDYLHHVPGELDIWSWLGKEGIAGSLFHAGSGHNVDLLRYFCGDVKQVACFKDVFLPRSEQVETEDTAVAIFRFESGAVGKVQCCVGPVLPFTFNFRLYGTHGSVINNRVYLDTIPRFDEPGHERDCIELPAAWIPDNIQGGISETWKASMDHFLDMLIDDAPSMNDIASAYKTSAVCFAAVAAAASQKIIDLKDIE